MKRTSPQSSTALLLIFVECQFSIALHKVRSLLSHGSLLCVSVVDPMLGSNNSSLGSCSDNIPPDKALQLWWLWGHHLYQLMGVKRETFTA